MGENFCTPKPGCAEIGGSIFWKNIWQNKTYLIALPCFSLAASPVLLSPSQRCSHTRLGLQGSDPVSDIPVIVSRSLSRPLARGQAAEGRNLEPGEPCPSQPGNGTGDEAGKTRRQLFPFFWWRCPRPAWHTQTLLTRRGVDTALSQRRSGARAHPGGSARSKPTSPGQRRDPGQTHPVRPCLTKHPPKSIETRWEQLDTRSALGLMFCISPSD